MSAIARVNLVAGKRIKRNNGTSGATVEVTPINCSDANDIMEALKALRDTGQAFICRSEGQGHPTITVEFQDGTNGGRAQSIVKGALDRLERSRRPAAPPRTRSNAPDRRPLLAR